MRFLALIFMDHQGEKMKTLIGLAIVAVILLMLAKAAAKQKTGVQKSGEERYKATPLLSENEKAWFNAIREALPHAHVFAQVALNQLVKAEGPKWRSAKNKIDPRSIDFVVLNPELAVLLAIEIDDRSHKLEKRQADDAKKNKALADAEITLLRFPATPVLATETVKARIVETLAAKARARAQG
jgi:very-short-patch-repair endonuclease